MAVQEPDRFTREKTAPPIAGPDTPQSAAPDGTGPTSTVRDKVQARQGSRTHISLLILIVSTLAAAIALFAFLAR